MPIFNQTFTEDKPIYYPSNWETGKTADQLYQQWKQTYQFFIISNFLQIICAGIWLFLLFVILTSIKELYRIYYLPDDNRQKMHNRKFMKSEFLITTGFVAIISIALTCGFLFDQFVRTALLKGGVSIAIGFLTYWTYQNSKLKYEQFKRRKNSYKKISKEGQQEQIKE